jgi:hypothetical protein
MASLYDLAFRLPARGQDVIWGRRPCTLEIDTCSEREDVRESEIGPAEVGGIQWHNHVERSARSKKYSPMRTTFGVRGKRKTLSRNEI